MAVVPDEPGVRLLYQVELFVVSDPARVKLKPEPE
jgi:hypothetical protein